MTKKKAKELCILKWQYIVDNNGSNEGVVNKYPELDKLAFECPYCEKYFDTRNNDYAYCAKCPIRLKKTVQCPIRLKKIVQWGVTSCMEIIHPYYKWYVNPTKKNAQAVLDLIIKS